VPESVQDDRGNFFTSSFSGGGGCVAVRLLPGGGAAVRHSKDPAQPAILTFDPREWDAFVRGVKAGEFDPLS
jgi:hypothetical protein